MDIEKFNPSEFTEKELLKFIYRDLLKMRNEFDDFTKDNTVQKDLLDMERKIMMLESELGVTKKLREESDKRGKSLIAWIALIMTAVQIAINLIFK